MSETGDRITRIYGSFRGVDFRGEEINISRSPDSLNVWKDYRETESIRTRPGMKLKTSFTDTVYGIFFYRDMMLVHSGKNLYKVAGGVKTAIYSGVNERESCGFVYEEKFYFLDGKNYLKYDGSTVSNVADDAFIPTTSIGRKPSGGGTIYQDVNFLSPYRKNSFVGNGVLNDDGVYTEGDWTYRLDAKNIDGVVSVEVNGEPISNSDFEVDLDGGAITFLSDHVEHPPLAPNTDGQDNVVITFKKTVEGYPEHILGCTMLQVFDNRVFVSGNPDYPNTVWHCSLNDPTYFSDLDYYREGLDSAQIKGLVAGNNALWVFREPSDANTTVFYHNPVIDEEFSKVYPSQHSSIAIGCVGKAINFNDDIVFFSPRGMEGVSVSDVNTEQAVSHRSSLVDRKLIAEKDYKNMILAEHEGYLFVFLGDRVYLADSRTAFTYENHIEYDWFYWELDKKIRSVKENGGVLYLGTDDGVYTLDDLTANVESYWVTPKDKFKAPNKLKTSNKRGCVVEATGDISVYAKTENSEFEHIGTYENIKDYFVSRIKRKKFKDIQLKFHSNTRFSLETATLECFIGGYIKR